MSKRIKLSRPVQMSGGVIRKPFALVTRPPLRYADGCGPDQPITSDLGNYDRDHTDYTNMTEARNEYGCNCPYDAH
jgi:hypothetical protein